MSRSQPWAQKPTSALENSSARAGDTSPRTGPRSAMRALRHCAGTSEDSMTGARAQTCWTRAPPS
jgi:hypothetical protein